MAVPTIDPLDIQTAARLEIALVGGALSLNGAVGIFQRLDYTDNYNFIPVRGIGVKFTIDYVPGIFEGTGDMSSLRLADQAIQLVAQAEHESLVEALNDRGLELIVRSSGGDALETLRKVRLNTSRVGIDVGSQLLIEDASFFFGRFVQRK